MPPAITPERMPLSPYASFALSSVLCSSRGTARRPTVCSSGKTKLHWKRIHNHFQNSFAHPLLAVQFDVSFRRRHLLGNIQIVIAFTILIAPAASRCFTELDRTYKVYSFLKQCLACLIGMVIAWHNIGVPSAEVSWKTNWKYPQIMSSEDGAKHCFKHDWTLDDLPFHFDAGTGGTFETLPLAQPP